MLAKYSKHKSSSKKQCSTFINELCHQFSLDELMKATDNFDRHRTIIVGCYKVYKGYVKHDGENDYPIALVRRRNEGIEFKNEIELHCQLCHPNLISLIGFCDEKNEKILVYKEDEMVNGSLGDHLCLRDMESLSWKKRLEICIGAAKGLHYLHTRAKRPIFHRDVKPQNILLDNNMEPKLCQLGLSLQGKLSKSESIPIKLDVISGTVGFIAPEYWETETFTDKCDVYSFGVVLLCVILCTDNFYTIIVKMNMLEGRDVILEPNIVGTLDEVTLFNPANFLERFPADEIIDPVFMRLISPECLAVFMDIMKRCLNIEPNERPTMGEVEVELEHALALQEEADRENI